MAATTEKFSTNQAPQLLAQVANGWKKENNNLIESGKLTLNDADNLQTTQAVVNYTQAAKFMDVEIDDNILRLTPKNNLLAPSFYLNGLNLFFIMPVIQSSKNLQISVNGLPPVPFQTLQGEPLQDEQLLAGFLSNAIFLESTGAFVFNPVLNKQELNSGIHSKVSLTATQDILQSESVIILFDTIDFENGVSYDIATNRMQFSRGGVYRISFDIAVNGETVDQGTTFDSTIKYSVSTLLSDESGTEVIAKDFLSTTLLFFPLSTADTGRQMTLSANTYFQIDKPLEQEIFLVLTNQLNATVQTGGAFRASFFVEYLGGI